ncbi:hypothetical protein [Neptuniibacter sp. QD37_11]|uniref:hypothetical protein n=1 Tax=Neptuniibacter sp. QD37_11 TaxID=3398209 RepID=UPI0039F4DBF6
MSALSFDANTTKVLSALNSAKGGLTAVELNKETGLSLGILRVITMTESQRKPQIINIQDVDGSPTYTISNPDLIKHALAKSGAESSTPAKKSTPKKKTTAKKTAGKKTPKKAPATRKPAAKAAPQTNKDVKQGQTEMVQGLGIDALDISLLEGDRVLAGEEQQPATSPIQEEVETLVTQEVASQEVFEEYTEEDLPILRAIKLIMDSGNTITQSEFMKNTGMSESDVADFVDMGLMTSESLMDDAVLSLTDAGIATEIPEDLDVVEAAEIEASPTEAKEQAEAEVVATVRTEGNVRTDDVLAYICTNILKPNSPQVRSKVKEAIQEGLGLNSGRATYHIKKLIDDGLLLLNKKKKPQALSISRKGSEQFKAMIAAAEQTETSTAITEAQTQEQVSTAETSAPAVETPAEPAPAIPEIPAPTMEVAQQSETAGTELEDVLTDLLAKSSEALSASASDEQIPTLLRKAADVIEELQAEKKRHHEAAIAYAQTVLAS